MLQPNPLAAAPTKDDMIALIDKVGDPEAWAQKWGAEEGHEETLYGSVARLLKLGVAQWDWDNDMSWEDIEFLFPNATPPTYWIMLYSEHVGDQALYQRLAVLARGFFDNVWNIPYAKGWARKALVAVAHDVGVGVLPEWLEAMDQRFGASATTKGNPTGKGKGFQSSKGNRKGKS